MRTFTIALLAGVGALAAASGAKAADLYTTSEYTSPDLIQEVRLVCDDAGNCYRTRGGARVIVRDLMMPCRASAITSAAPIAITTGTTVRAPASAFARPASAWASVSATAGKPHGMTAKDRTRSLVRSCLRQDSSG